MKRVRTTVRALFSVGVLAAAVTVPCRADWTASGTAQYRDRDFGPTGFSGVEPLLPVRFADVEILDAGALSVLASGSTDASGAFSIQVPDSQIRDVQVRVLTRGLATADLNLQVTAADLTPYAIAAPPVSGHLPDADLDFGTLIAEIGQGGEAFNCWDNGLHGTDFLAYLQGSRPGPADFLSIVWEIDRGQPASTASASRIDMRDTSAYDDTVLLHEYAHFVVFNFSASSNPGGAHGFSQCNQDPRLSWEEGHATFFGAAARRHAGLALPNIYLRTTGAAGPGGVALYADLETETAYECSGSTSEVSVFTALWDIVDGAGEADFTPGLDDAPMDRLSLDPTEHWEVMTDSLPGRSNISTEDYWDAWFEAPVENGFLPEMISIFAGVEIEYFEDAFEPNDTRQSAASIVPDGLPLHATFFRDPEADGSGGNVQDPDWFGFQAFAGMAYQVETMNLWSAADTIVSIRDAGGSSLAANDDRSAGDPSSFLSWVAPGTGTYYVQVTQPGDLTPYGSYDLKIVPPPDQDGDGIPNEIDVCPVAVDPGQANTDGDASGDACDNCPLVANDGQQDADSDGAGNACDACPFDAADDLDADGLCAEVDNCPAVANGSQSDFDQDTEGDVCDQDDGLIYITFAQPDLVEWQAESFSKWNSYRGDLDVLRTTGTYTQDPSSNPLVARTCRLKDPFVADATPLLPGETVFFLTTGVQGANETDLGTDGLGQVRFNDHPCP